MNKTDSSRLCPQCGSPLPPDSPAGLCPRCLMDMNLATPTHMGKDDSPDGAMPRRPTAPDPEEIAHLFPQLEVLEFLGQGGMGVVYKARQRDLDRIVALKILPKEIGDAPGFAERFTREARALAKLNHPGIVTIYDFGKADGLYFFLMEYVEDMNLRRLLHGRRISPREALAIIPQICDALQYAHDHGVVHRDIKPENILMDRLGRVKVADFGLAKIIEGRDGSPSRPSGEGESVGAENLTEVGKVMGTPQYMSPEQVDAPGAVDHRADIYALGVVFYQMLTGEMPGTPPQPPSKKVRIDVRLDEVVLRALEQKPERRYQQASVLKTHVESIAAGPGNSPGRTERTAAASPDSRTEVLRGDPRTSGREGDGATPESTINQLRWPSVGLMAAAFLDFYGFLMSVGLSSSGPTVFFMVVAAIVVFAGTCEMRRGRLYPFAVATCFVAMLPPGLYIGLPAGVWTLSLLVRPGMKEAFDHVKQAGSTSGSRRLELAVIGIMLLALCLGLIISGPKFWATDAFIDEVAGAGAEEGAPFPGLFCYDILVPAHHEIQFSVELWKDGQRQDSSGIDLPSLRPHLQEYEFRGTAEFRLQDGGTLNPAEDGKLRWDWKAPVDLGHPASPGGWIDDPFAGMSAQDSTWRGTRHWRMASGRECTLLILRGDKEGLEEAPSDAGPEMELAEAIEKGVVKRADVELHVKARLKRIHANDPKAVTIRIVPAEQGK